MQVKTATSVWAMMTRYSNDDPHSSRGQTVLPSSCAWPFGQAACWLFLLGRISIRAGPHTAVVMYWKGQRYGNEAGTNCTGGQGHRKAPASGLGLSCPVFSDLEMAVLALAAVVRLTTGPWGMGRFQYFALNLGAPGNVCLVCSNLCHFNAAPS
jgi:hypothetical protein